MFLNRDNNQVIQFAGNQALNLKVVNGNKVELRENEGKILVENIIAIDPHGQYCGIIYGYEISTAIENNGLTVGQEITFSEKQIFGCISD